MATLQQIRDGIKSTLEATIPSLHVYDTAPDAASILPCVVVVPTDADYNKAFQRGTDEWQFDLLVLAPYADASLGQDLLDTLISGAGTDSIRQAIFNNKTLGLAGVDATVMSMTNYGSTISSGGVDHIGATLRLMVVTPGGV